MLAIPLATPQIWLFYAFSLVFAALVVRMLVRRTKELGGRKDGKSRHGIILQSLGMGFTAIGPARTELSWFSAVAIMSYAVVLLLMGSACALFASSSGQLGKNWSLQARTRDDHELVRSGPYARVRHPIYLAMLLFLFGMAVAFGHWVQLLIAVPVFVIGTRMRTEAEERLLEQSFGDEYRDYRKSTPALIPRLN